jgi:hypothetical protein
MASKGKGPFVGGALRTPRAAPRHPARHSRERFQPCEITPLPGSLTTHCSGLATLATEFDLVRRVRPGRERHADHTVTPSLGQRPPRSRVSSEEPGTAGTSLWRFQAVRREDVCLPCQPSHFRLPSISLQRLHHRPSPRRLSCRRGAIRSRRVSAPSRSLRPLGQPRWRTVCALRAGARRGIASFWHSLLSHVGSPIHVEHPHRLTTHSSGLPSVAA